MPITTTTIEHLERPPSTRNTKRVFYEVPEVYEPQPSKRKAVRSNYLGGVRANVPKTHFLAALFLANEIEACKGKPASRDVLRRKMLKEYPDGKKGVYSTFSKYSTLRRSFNEGKLYMDQTMPPLFCWTYNDAGFIVKSGNGPIMGFEDCLLELKAKNFIDPRFYSQEEINTLREKRLNGDPKALKLNIPLQEEIDKISKAVDPTYEPYHMVANRANILFQVNPLYNSITFPEGYRRNYK